MNFMMILLIVSITTILIVIISTVINVICLIEDFAAQTCDRGGIHEAGGHRTSGTQSGPMLRH